jgi:hypothetical protein
MVQSGYFPGSSIHCVATRDGVVVIAGNAVDKVKSSDKAVPGSPEIVYDVPAFKPVQPSFGGGKQDGYFAVFKLSK